MSLKKKLLLPVFLWAFGFGALQAATPETLVIISNGEKIGILTGVTDGQRVEVDYYVDDNGRGPKHHESILLGEGDIPVSWSVAGTSLMGANVSESYNWQGGVATWSSQADEGRLKLEAPKLYVVNDGSSWALGVYARALLKTKERRLAVLPGGELSLTRIRDMELGEGKAETRVTVYRLAGIDLTAAYIMLDEKERLFASFSPDSVLIREGYEAEADKLLLLGSELSAELAEERQKALAYNFDVPVRIRNVHVFDPESGKLGPLSTVVVMRHRITAVIPVGEDAPGPEDQVIIDGEGGTLVPGLHDMHSHTSRSSGLYYLAAGVTSVRDQGNNNAFLLDLLRRLEAGESAGPRITYNGFLEGRSPYSASHGIIAETIEEAIEAVSWYADRGYWQIKIYNSMNPDWVATIARAAKKRGMGLTGHVPAFGTPDRTIIDGYEDIAHINQLMLGWLLEPGEDTRTPLRLRAMARGAYLDLDTPKVHKTIDLMKERNIALDTTAVILERLMLSRAGTVADGDKPYLDHMPIGYQRYRKRTFVPLKSAQDDEEYQKGFQKILETIKLLHDNNIRLLPGTDDGTGFTVLRELELYTMAGLSPAESLRSATIGCAEYLGTDADLGTIERGKLADFFLIPGDPTKDISEIRKARMVMRGGTIYFPSEIYDALSITPFSTKPAITVPGLAE
ncbi:amidohydrolase family protein [Kordiimonas pumila]|uniref:Amidohydrolase family protein n=1 Tax=Kordiimonas pumila TaxID=2161677 RepID=A0ABV7D3S1_9PROT|nr:amidohydrolase family protein [Kordiimonas pumila]